MDFTKYIEFIKKYQSISEFPTSESYPKTLKIDSSIWSQIQMLHKFTSQFDYEHSISLYDVAGTTITTAPIKGSKTQVQTRHEIKVEYKHKIRDWYNKNIFVNGKLQKKIEVKGKDIRKDPRIDLLFTIHSHPAVKAGDELNHSFFSDVDLNSLFSSNSLCIGLVTDELLLACKHSKSPISLNEETSLKLTELNRYYFNRKDLPSEILDSLGIVLFKGSFKKELKRMN